MLSEDSSEVFQEIANAAAKQKILAELVSGKHELTLANKKIPELQVRAIHLSDATLDLEFDGITQFTDGEKLKAYFHIGNQHYFLETSFHLNAQEPGKATMPTGGGLYVRQLRKHFRMVVPQGYSVQFMLEKNGQDPIPCQVHDISLNGMLVHFKTGSTPVIGAEVQGELRIGKRKPFKIAGTVRHFNGGTGPEYFGVEFSHLVFKSETTLQELLLMYRHDTFYLKKAKAVPG